MKKIALLTISIASVAIFSGCAHKIVATPAVMTYDGSSVDYSKVESMKHAKVCKDLGSSDGDTTIIAAAKLANISKVKHVDTSFEFSQFLFSRIGEKNCVTVYGE